MALSEAAEVAVPDEERYGVYVVVPGEREPRLLATGGLDAVGAMIACQDDDARAAGVDGLPALGHFGLLDRIEHRWLVKPWSRGDHV